ncbi:MAG: alpha-amylase family glycosyl hydrolase [Acidobacteriota bacterium]
MTSIHLTSYSRDKNGIKGLSVSGTGKTLLQHFRDAEYVSDKLKENHHKYKKMSPALIYAVSLIDEVFQFLIDSFITGSESSYTEDCYIHLKKKLGTGTFDLFLSEYSETYGPDKEIKESSSTLLKDLITLGSGYNNSAYIPFRDIFFSTKTEQNKIMFTVYSEIESFFDEVPGFGPDAVNLIRFLHIPSEKSPGSVMGQLNFILENWGDIIGDLRSKLLTGLDHLKEENKFRGHGSGPVSPYSFNSVSEEDPENFSEDSDWMSSLVLLAKSTYVWLDQLSVMYNQDIKRIDQIPDDELDRIRSMGFSGLWLIGLWERSNASAEIKRRTGNPEAMASAYSINDYTISNDLGGEDAFLSLKRRAADRGIRLAADMVPNHMGLDSKWVKENPEWFVSSDIPPFGSYTFNGPDLCKDERYSINLEDHYYNKSDAAVVFELVDHNNGNKRYIYHGNDGTSMPWNDTAQLNYLRDDVRRYIIDTILKIAGKFNIIRFDAAMILTKKHFQRLWFPEPGQGGDIPSRAGRGITSEEFNKLFPNEFWIDVVKNIEERSPDTLLLAEAFWMMEPYFVRTLGMHRVYNSAFMNFLKSEGNREFRISIKNTIEFNPEILKRFANFMNNPDEETAINQFGSDDKYFGVCTLLATLPGLPMFGHGQIEGYREKYGMEYRKAYLDESPDQDLFERHRREIFPLLKKRNIFSHSENFRLYDFFDKNGEVNEDVIAYSNSYNDNYSLVVYNNRYSECAGSIHSSSGFNKGTGKKSEHFLTTETIAKALNVHNRKDDLIIFRDNSSSLYYIRKNSEIINNGLYFELGAFKYHVFLDFRIVADNEKKKYLRICHFLNGNGTPDPELLYNIEINNPLTSPLSEFFRFNDYFDFHDQEEYKIKIPGKDLLALFYKFPDISEQIFNKIINNTNTELNILKELTETDDLISGISNEPVINIILPASIILRNLGMGIGKESIDKTTLNFSEYYLKEILEKIYRESGIDLIAPEKITGLILLCMDYFSVFTRSDDPESFISGIKELISDERLIELTNVNRWDGKLWYNSGELIFLIKAIFIYSCIIIKKNEQVKSDRFTLTYTKKELYLSILQAEKDSENLYEKFKAELMKKLQDYQNY